MDEKALPEPSPPKKAKTEVEAILDRSSVMKFEDVKGDVVAEGEGKPRCRMEMVHQYSNQTYAYATINFYGKASAKTSVKAHLHRYGFILIDPPSYLPRVGASPFGTPFSASSGYSSSPPLYTSGYRYISSSQQKKMSEEELDTFFQQTIKQKISTQVSLLLLAVVLASDLALLHKVPPAKLAAAGVKTGLLQHQLEAVAWMYSRETNPDGGELPPLYEEKGAGFGKYYYNKITQENTPERPKNVKGGILADDMGLGKTLSCLALIAFTKMEEKEKDQRPTLVVCPLSVIQNWERQVEDHLEPETCRVHVYHGPGRHQTVKDVYNNEYDIVLTTFQTLALEVELVKSKNKKGFKKVKKEDRVKRVRKVGCRSLLDVKYRRVILDEAHIIRNRMTRAFAAVDEVVSDTKWCLTGTPFVNNTYDLQSLMQYLKSEPLMDIEVFNKYIGRPLKWRGDPVALGKLRVLMGVLCMRRTKDLLKDRLPPKEEIQHDITMAPAEKEVYDILFDSAKLLFEAMLAMNSNGDFVFKHYTHILESLLRLRQACTAAALVPEERVENSRQALKAFAKKFEEKKRLTEKEVKEMMDILTKTLKEGDSSEVKEGEKECVVCYEAHTDEGIRILSKCKHNLCNVCLEKIVDREKGQARCPMCREPFTMGDVKGLKDLKEDLAEFENEGTCPPCEQEDEDFQAKVKSEPGVKAEGSRRSSRLSSRMSELLEDAAEEETPAVGVLPAKAEALIRSMEEGLKENGVQKCVVYSQFVKHLNLLQTWISQRLPQMQVLRLDGKMSAARRKFDLDRFADTEVGVPQCFLISIKAGGVGINLTSSNKAYLMDLWWNAAVEDQAMDRVHRIGQTKPVTITKFVAEKSVERKILKMQEAKQILGKGAVQRVDSEKVRKARLDVLRGFFEKDHRVDPEEEPEDEDVVAVTMTQDEAVQIAAGSQVAG